MEAQLTRSETALEVKRTFQAPVSLVYQAWTEPEMMNGWFHPKPNMTCICSVDLRVGGRYEVKMRHQDDQVHVVAGVYREIIPQEKLVFTWQWQGEEAYDETLVTVLFRSLGDAETELTLRHEQFLSDEERDSHASGWQGVFDQLAAALG